LLKLGIVAKSSIPTKWRHDQRPPPIALTLRGEFLAPLTDADEARLTLLCRSIPGDAYTHMTNDRQRWQTVDQAIMAEFEANYSPGRAIRLRETAASNGIPSLELFEAFDRRWGRAVSLLATAYYDALYIVPVAGSPWRVIFDALRNPIQFVGRRFVISAQRKERGKHLLNRLIRQRLMATILPNATSILSVGTSPSIQRVSLYHPRCQAMAAADPRFSLDHENAYDPAPMPCDILRSMNLTSLHPREDPRPTLAAMCRPLEDGGLWILGSRANGPSPAAGTIFRRRGPRFVALRDIEGGYELREAVMNLELA
jgi:hypothetical protein